MNPVQKHGEYFTYTRVFHSPKIVYSYAGWINFKISVNVYRQLIEKIRNRSPFYYSHRLTSWILNDNI